jgi:iron complex outermembrane recepter protein
MQKNHANRPTRRSLAVACTGCLLPAASPTFAQDADESRGTLTVEVTGSHIKRTDAETALPVQIITRDEIDHAAWTTAGELMAHVSTNLGGFNDQLSFGQFETAAGVAELQA